MKKSNHEPLDDKNYLLAKIAFETTYAGYKWLSTDEASRKQLQSLRIDSKKFHALASMARGRFDSYRVLMNTIPGSNNSDIAAALLTSLCDNIENIESTFTNGEKCEVLFINASRFREKIEPFFIRKLYFDKKTITQEDLRRLNKTISKLLQSARQMAPAPVIFLWLLRFSKNLLSQINFSGDTGKSRILRELHFSPEHQQAGVSILNYFSQIVSQKYPNENVSVSIRQQNNLVTMCITSPEGLHEEVTKTLDDYGLVVTGKKTAQEFLGVNHHALALQAKLEMAQLEIRTTERLLAAEKAMHSQQISRLEIEVDRLFSMVQEGISTSNTIQNKLLEHLKASQEQEVSPQVAKLFIQISESIITRNEQQLRLTAEDLKTTNPSIFERVTSLVTEGTFTGVIGNATYDWLRILWPLFPK